MIALACAALLVAEVPAPKVAVERGIVYAEVGGATLRLDIARPAEGKGPFPLVVCLHGGAWRGGHRSDLSKPDKFFGNRSLIELLAEQGYVAATVSYRLAPEAKFPAQIIDCKSAVRWLRANATKYHIAPDRVAALGFSAGGHLACLLATCEPADGFDVGANLDQSSAVRAAVVYFQPTDISMYADMLFEESMIAPWLGAVHKDKPELFRRASPMSYCRKTCPPMLFLHGTEDLLVPVDHSRKMVGRLKQLGVAAELIEMDGESHGWVGEPVKKSTAATLRFLAEQLKR